MRQHDFRLNAPMQTLTCMRVDNSSFSVNTFEGVMGY
jgi:hypothetical protein